MRLADVAIWSGTAVTLISRDFARPANLPTVRLLGDTVPVARLDDTSLAAQLPDLPGTYFLQVQYPYDSATVGPLRLYGFGDVVVGPPLKGVLRAWPDGPVPMVLGIGVRSLVQYSLRDNLIARTWPDSIHSPDCNWGAGASFRPNTVVLQGKRPDGRCGWFRSWRLYPTLEAGDSAPGVSDVWGIAELADGLWISTVDDFYALLDCRSGTCQASNVGYGGATDPVISPRGDRVALDGGYPAWSPQVLDPQSGGEVYRVRRLHAGYASAFTADGDTLFMVGQDTSSLVTVVVAVSAADGTEFASAAVDSLVAGETYPTGFAIDPVEPLLYVAGLSAKGWAPTLLVFDRVSLQLLATLRAPAEVAPYYTFLSTTLRVVPAPLYGYVYVIRSRRSYEAPLEAVSVFRFERLP